MNFEQLATAALNPDGSIAKQHQLLRFDDMVGRRDPLTELQQKIITAAVALLHKNQGCEDQATVCKMAMTEFIALCSADREDMPVFLTNEIEKLLKKGVSLCDELHKKMTRVSWFQAIEYDEQEVIFQFAEKILPVVMKFTPNEDAYRLTKKLQYKGKHTLAVLDIIWPSRSMGVTELTIPELMQQLALEHTRYSYGQLRLRVLEPSLEEIYAWDDAIFVRFGPTFSGRRVEGVWFEVTVGEKAKELREKEPEFKFSLPEEKPVGSKQKL